MQGVQYNLVLILAPLTFWAMVKWRFLAAAAIDAWRSRRSAQAGLSPVSPAVGPSSPLPQVSAPRDGSGDTPRRGPGEGPGGVPGDRARPVPGPVVETLDDGTRGVWIKVGRATDDGEVSSRG